MKWLLIVLTLLVLPGLAIAAQQTPPPTLADAEISLSVDTVVSWLAVGVLVAWLVTALGAIVGGKKRSPGLSLILGLVGATAGGFAVSAFQIDWNLGSIVISYESLLAALAGALVLVVVPWFLFNRGKKK